MNYKRTSTAFILLAVAALSCYGIDAKKAKNKTMANKGFAVIELFTSEGCSSCPSADELVSKVLNEHNDDVYILSYHVDYWNRLGWKDEFSKAAFSDRQKQYARRFALEGVYTPQIVVNGSNEFVGSDETRLRSSLKNRQPGTGLDIKAESNNETVQLTYTRAANTPVLLNIALVQPEAFTAVKRGENSGRRLHHVNIVRELTTIETSKNTGSITMQIPKELVNMPLQLVAFTQQKDNYNITGVMQLSIHQ